MKTSSTFLLSFLFLCTTLISGCNGVGTAEVAGIGANTGNSVAVFLGLDSIDEVTDSTVKLNWTSHPDAAAYDVFEKKEEGLRWRTTVFQADASSVVLDQLEPGKTYKFLVRVKDDQGRNDTNLREKEVTLNFVPDRPASLEQVFPASSPSFDYPIIKISGVKKGDLVKVYSDSTCETELASKLAQDDEVEIEVTNLFGGVFQFYADATNNLESRSECSSQFLSYTKIACPQEKGVYIPVPADPNLGTDNFCVMKYEASCAGDLCPSSSPNIRAYATSNDTSAKWAMLKPENAMKACQSIGEGYDIISNPEWMAIARNIEQEESNWVDGIINRGWSATLAIDGFSNSIYAPHAQETCEYNTGPTTCGTSGDHELKRTHRLSNGEDIWDLASNYMEWVDWAVEEDNINNFTRGPTGCSNGLWEIQAKINDCFSASPNLGNPAPDISPHASPLNYNLNSLQNIGKAQGGVGGVAVRGGGRSSGMSAGIYSLALDKSLTYGYSLISFRCVYRP